MAGDSCGAGIEPVESVLKKAERMVGRSVGCIAQGVEEERMYQSIDCGGSSLDGEVLTVSTQPKRKYFSQGGPC